MALSIFEETFGTARNRYGVVSKREATADHLVAITAAVQAVVDTFRDPNTGDRYVVGMSAQTEAYTMPGTKRIVVSYKPIFDKGLKVSTACTVMTGLVLHEIGHTLYTFPNMPAIEAAFGKPNGYRWGPPQHDQLAYSMLNVGDDARLEARMAENLPVARDIFPTMLHWVALSTGMTGNRLRWRGKAMKMAERINFACRAIRYPWTATWSSDAVTRAERLWWQDWGRKYIALDDRDADGMVALVKVALDRLRNAEEVEDTEPDAPVERPEPPVITEKNPFGEDFDKEPSEDEDDEEEDADDDEADEDEESEDDGDEPWDEGDEDEDAEDESEGKGKGDEPDDEADEDESEGEGDGEDDEDDDEDGPDRGGSKVDVPDELGDDEAPGDDKGEDDDGDGTEDSGSNVAPTEDAKPKPFPQDFDAHELDGNVDAVNHPGDWKSEREGALLQKAIDTEATTERISTGTWGAAKVEVMDMGKFAHRGY